jgi:hypothetical protein
MTNACWKLLPEEVLLMVWRGMKLCMRAGEYPEALAEIRVVLLYKKGDPALIENWRSISLFNTHTRIWDTLLDRVLKAAVEARRILPVEQHGFRAGRGTATKTQQWMTRLELLRDQRRDVQLIHSRS